MDSKIGSIDLRIFRKNCVDKGLNFVEELQKLKSKQQYEPKIEVKLEPKIKREKKTKVSKSQATKIVLDEIVSEQQKLSPYDSVITMLDELRTPNVSKTYTLDEFLDLMITKFPDQMQTVMDTTTSMKGYVSNVLYTYAIGEKDDSFVSTDKLEKNLKITFDQASLKHILGHLDKKYVLMHYKTHAGLFGTHSLTDAHGKAYSIEGLKAWGGMHGDEKECIRDDIVKLVDKQLIQNLIKDREINLARIDHDIEKIYSSIKTGQSQSKSFYRRINVDCKFPEIRNSFRDSFLREFKKTHHKEFESGNISVMPDGKKNLLIKFEHDALQNAFIKEWEKFQHSNPGTNYARKVDLIIMHDAPKISAIQEIDNLESEKKEILKKNSINYLGLEGANFGSYLRIKQLADNYGLKISSIIPEYQFRIGNIMRSVVNANEHDLFDNVNIRQGNIDDLILLDFASNPEFSVIRQEKNFKVKFGQEELSVEKYHSILHAMDMNRTKKHIMADFDVSELLIDNISDRPKEKFDIVFLDYVKGANYIERDKLVLETLVNRRLSDKAIVAMTINTSHYMNKYPVEKIPSIITSIFGNIFKQANYSFHTLKTNDYSSSKSDMHCLMFYVEKIKDQDKI